MGDAEGEGTFGELRRGGGSRVPHDLAKSGISGAPDCAVVRMVKFGHGSHGG